MKVKEAQHISISIFIFIFIFIYCNQRSSSCKACFKLRRRSFVSNASVVTQPHHSLQFGCGITDFSPDFDIEQQIRIRGNEKGSPLAPHGPTAVPERRRNVQQGAFSFFHLQDPGRPSLNQIDSRLEGKGLLFCRTIFHPGRPSRRGAVSVLLFDVQGDIALIAVFCRHRNGWTVAFRKAFDDDLWCCGIDDAELRGEDHYP